MGWTGFPGLSFLAASFFQWTSSYSSPKAHSGGPHGLGAGWGPLLRPPEPAPAAVPSHQQQLPLASPRPQPPPDVHGEERAAAVEDGGQRRHERGHHHRDHQAPQTCGQRRCWPACLPAPPAAASVCGPPHTLPAAACRRWWEKPEEEAGGGGQTRGLNSAPPLLVRSAPPWRGQGPPWCGQRPSWCGQRPPWCGQRLSRLQSLAASEGHGEFPGRRL